MTKNSPRISVAIATYNRAHLLGRSIQSVLDQTYQDFELIVVDDGSTDNTEEVVRSFNDGRIRYIRHERNKGLSATRNTGIKAAKGDYIAFQDSDDEWLPQKLEKQLKVFKTAPPEVGIVYTGFWRIEGKKKIYIPSRRVKQKEGNIHKELLKGNFITAQASMVKKKCLQISGMFDEQIPSRQDWELWLRISRDWHFEYVDSPLVIVYSTPDSISANLDVIVTGRKLILEKHFNEFKKNRLALASLQYSIGNSLCQNGEINQGKGYLIGALKSYPFNPKYLMATLLSLLGENIYNKVVRLKGRVNL